jgi:thioredoxin-dependent peroxiredoxin
MAQTALRGNVVNLVGELPAVGSPTPSFLLTKSDLSDITEADLTGQRVVLNIFPSIDTPTCQESVRKFNGLATELTNTIVLNVSADLPFAQTRFCGTEGLTNVSNASTFRGSFGSDYGIAMVDGRLAGLLARAVVVLDETGTVLHSQLVPEIADEPDYDAALAALA